MHVELHRSLQSNLKAKRRLSNVETGPMYRVCERRMRLHVQGRKFLQTWRFVLYLQKRMSDLRFLQAQLRVYRVTHVATSRT